MEKEIQLDMNCIPSHVAIIMDGNGRWAKQRGMERTYGHQAGAETVHQIAEEAARLGIKYLTLYTFSTENWNRPPQEVAALMDLLFNHIEEETFMKNNISFKVIGDIDKLPDFVQGRCQEKDQLSAGAKKAHAHAEGNGLRPYVQFELDVVKCEQGAGNHGKCPYNIHHLRREVLGNSQI